jgi:hypothetical protein
MANAAGSTGTRDSLRAFGVTFSKPPREAVRKSRSSGLPVSIQLRKVVGLPASYSDLRRPCFSSYFATSALRSFSTKLERLLFSWLASARSLAFKARSIFSEIVVSFIPWRILQRNTTYHQGALRLTFSLTKQCAEVILSITTSHRGPMDKGTLRKTPSARPGRARRRGNAFLSNAKHARAMWGAIPRIALDNLAELTEAHGLSVAAGDLQFLDGRWYVTHSGLLRIAQGRRCSRIRTALQKELTDPATNRWIFKATVYKTAGSKGFVGYGDAEPTNTSPLVRGAEMRVAETRAVNRALRKAYGIGLCSVEELGWLAGSSDPSREPKQSVIPPHLNGSNNGQPRLRDQLCLLIRQYNLDPTQVKAYAADFCGTPTLKEASRELVESFISHLATSAKENRDALICKLNSYAQPVEVKP